MHPLLYTEIATQTVLLREDFNVPLQDGNIMDDTRLRRALPTLQELLKNKCKVIVLSHLGRPQGKVEATLSLRPVAMALEKLLKVPVTFIPEYLKADTLAYINAIDTAQVIMLENLRFHPGEEANDPDFAAHLASLGDIYVNDAFSISHRAHASVEAITKLLPSYAGAQMEAELAALAHALENPKRPIAAIVGGSKVSTKLAVLENLCQKVELLIPAGGIANTFLYARGIEIGDSLCEKDMVTTVQAIEKAAQKHNTKIWLPEDFQVASSFTEAARIATPTTIMPQEKIFDIGPASQDILISHLSTIATVVWNGPLGVFEHPPFDHGTNKVAQYIAGRSACQEIYSLAGGGETVAALAHAGVVDHFSYISTAGGAFLEYLEGKTLPGIQALRAAA